MFPPKASNKAATRGVSMRSLKTSEAAALLSVSPNTLRAWERRFGYPRPERSPGRHRIYAYGEVEALREALHDGLSASSAISRVRERSSGDKRTLLVGLTGFEAARAEATIEAVLVLRSVERTIGEVLMPAVDELWERYGTDSAQWAFAARWAGDWLRRITRLTPPPTHEARSILIGDATGGELDPDAVATVALEVLCSRLGVRVLTLSARGVGGINDLVAARRPHLVAIAGCQVDNDAVARWAYAVRATAGPLPVALFRRGAAMRTTTTTVLADAPADAARRIVELAESHDHERDARTHRTSAASQRSRRVTRLDTRRAPA
jgi:DNA-binding transcriptional MerR regulator